MCLDLSLFVFVCKCSMFNNANKNAAKLINVGKFENWPFSGTNPLIYRHPWPFLMRICYMRAHFLGHYLSDITRDLVSEVIKLNE